MAESSADAVKRNLLKKRRLKSNTQWKVKPIPKWRLLLPIGIMLPCLQPQSPAINAAEPKATGGQCRPVQPMRHRPISYDAPSVETPGEDLINNIG